MYAHGGGNQRCGGNGEVYIFDYFGAHKTGFGFGIIVNYEPHKPIVSVYTAFAGIWKRGHELVFWCLSSHQLLQEGLSAGNGDNVPALSRSVVAKR